MDFPPYIWVLTLLLLLMFIFLVLSHESKVTGKEGKKMDLKLLLL